MKINEVKEPVKVRTKELKNGVQSLYLDIYLNGKRTKENLKLYLYPTTDKVNERKNKETLKRANAIKAKKIVELQEGLIDFKKKSDIKLMDYMVDLREEYKVKKSVNFYYTSKSVILHLGNFVEKNKAKGIKLKDVDKFFVYGFIEHLETSPTYRGVPLSKESIYTYYMHFCMALNKAVKRGYIGKNPCDMVMSEDKPKRSESTREYLTLEEIKLLIGTECKDIRVKRMFLFACFTGLRYSDIFGLRWKNIKRIEDNVYQLELVQKKTKQPITIPLTENAMNWMPNRGMDGEENQIFPMPETSCSYDYLHDWVKKAGIDKKVTFHVGRHTYATLLLYYGADLYTVSKLLGHKSVKTTQIYAKVMDDSKRKAVSLIPSI